MHKTPFPLFLADVYSLSSHGFVSDEAKESSYYTLTNRYSPKDSFKDVANDSRMVFYGLSRFINKYLTTRITQEEILESAEFMDRANSFGGALFFPKDMWLNIVNDMGGYLPIEIRGLEECSTFFPNVPYVSVKSTADGYGEFAAAIEAGITGFVSIHTARTTFLRHWLERIKEWVQKDVKSDDDEVLYATAQFMLHDFSMRAHALPEEAESLGLCNLLCFHGSDTSSSCYQAWRMGCHPQSGTSIIAAAHRNIQSDSSELDCFEKIHETSKLGGKNIASYLLDCYNFQDCVMNSLVKIADKYPNDTFVGRGDSGDALKNILFILQQNRKNIRYIEGNSIKPQSMFKIMDGIQKAGYSITKGIFGVGGCNKTGISRDSLSTAFKLASISNNNTPVMKLSEDKSKMSIPGPNSVTYNYGDNKQLNHVTVDIGEENLETYYLSRKDYTVFSPRLETKFSELQDRTINHFDQCKELAIKNPEYGLNRETLSYKVKDIQDKFHQKYKGRKPSNDTYFSPDYVGVSSFR